LSFNIYFYETGLAHNTNPAFGQAL